MDVPRASRRIAGALQFLVCLQAFADECAAAELGQDELSARRRRLREDVLERVFEEVQVKAL